MKEENNDGAEIKKPQRFITVRELVRRKGEVLCLRRISGLRSMDRRITVKHVNRPGLAIAGHMDQFRSERIQIIGQGEEAYCRKEDKRRVRGNLNRMFESGEIPCVIMSGGVNPLPVIRKAHRCCHSRSYGTHLFHRTPFETETAPGMLKRSAHASPDTARS